MKSSAQIIAIGGGKGGVGKSSVAANLAIALAQAGHPTFIVDLDLGGANLHTLFGIKTTERGIGDYIYGTEARDLAACAVDPGIERLKLISGNGFIPGIANLEHQKKLKVLRALHRLDAAYVILDLGAGTSYNVIDFFAIARSGIVVTLPEPTAILNAYEFVKNVVFRIFAQRFRPRRTVLDVIDEFKTGGEGGARSAMEALVAAVQAKDAGAAEEMNVICREFRPGLILNMSRGHTAALGKSLTDICATYLNIAPVFLGAVAYDDAVRQALYALKPVMLAFPDSPTARSVREIAERCIQNVWLDRDVPEDEPAIEEERVADASERPVAAHAPSPGGVSELLKGRRESELSGLLGSFLSATYVELKSRGAEDAAGAAAKATPGAAPTAESAPALTLDVRIEPRMDPALRVPLFAVMEPIRLKPQGLFDRWFGFLSPAAQQGAAVTSAVTRILKIAEADNPALSLQMMGAPVLKTPEVGSAWTEVGLKLVQADRMSLAQTAFAHALVCLPHNPAVAANRAASLIATGLIEPAHDVLVSGLPRAPDDAFLNYNQGLVYLARAHYAEAALCFEKAARRLPERALAAAFVGALCLFQAGRYAEAWTVFHKIAEADPLNLNARFNVALARLRAGEMEAAVAAFTGMLAVAPEDAEALAGRGLACWRLERVEEASADLTRAVKLRPADIALRSARCAMSCRRGLYDLAIEDIQTITGLVPGNAQFQQLLTEIRAKIGG